MTLLLSNWRIILAAVVVAGAFFSGWQVRAWKADADTLAAIEKMEANHIAEMQIAADIIGAEAEKQQEVRDAYSTLLRKAGDVNNGTCGDVDFIRLWNESNRAATDSETNKPDDQL